MRWLSSKEVPNTPKIHSVALPTGSPEHRKQSTRIDLPVKPFPSVSSESSDDMPSFFSFGSRHREARVSNNLITPTVINDEPRTRTRSDSMKPLKGILKAAAHHSPEAAPILMPRPRKASRSSPVEMIEHAVHARAPSRMQTPIETRPIRAPSGWPQEAAPVHHHAFPPKPSRATHPIDATPGIHVFPAQIPTQRDRHRVDPITPHFNFPPKPPSHIRPSTAMDNYPTHRPAEKPAKSSHRHRSSNNAEKERKHKDRSEDKDKRHKRREDKAGDRERRERGGERAVQTDNEDWARPRDVAETGALPFQMEKIPLDDILLPEPIMVKTKSKEWKEKLSIRYNITKNPYTTVIDRWNKITKRYEPIDRAEYDMSMAPCRLITRCYVVTASTPVFGEKITDPTGVHCVDVLHMVYRCYNIVLTSAEREYYKDVMETDEFRRWFKYRCQQAENPEEERRLGPKRVDLLQGNVFYQGVKYLGNDTWEVQMYRNVDNSLYFVE